MNRDVQLSLWDQFQVLLDMYPEVELLDHIVIMFLILWGTSIISIVVITTPFYIPTNSAQKLQFLHILANTYCLVRFFFFTVFFTIFLIWELKLIFNSKGSISFKRTSPPFVIFCEYFDTCFDFCYVEVKTFYLGKFLFLLWVFIVSYKKGLPSLRWWKYSLFILIIFKFFLF